MANNGWIIKGAHCGQLEFHLVGKVKHTSELPHPRRQGAGIFIYQYLPAFG